jgi:4-hydroxy-2-oxoheptanedioate aldolase
MAYDIEGGRAASAGQSLRELVRSGRTGHGAWCMLAGGLITEVVTAAGPDWICLDTQHGLIDDASMRTMVQAAELRGTPVFVRVPWNDEAAIMRALDAGAEGIIVPMVNSEAEARKAAGASRYPPVGFRSWGPLRSGMAIAGFDPPTGNDRTVCLVMVETIEGVENLDAILDVPGVDGVMVGPNDLAISHAGTNKDCTIDPKNLGLIQTIADGCQKRGLAAGISCANAEEAHRFEAMGYTLLGLPSDAALLGSALVQVLSDSRAGAPVS